MDVEKDTGLPLYVSGRVHQYGPGYPLLVNACANGVVVPDIENNPGLVNDCVALLEAEGLLTGDSGDNLLRRTSLNWGPDVTIFDWDEVTVLGPPYRVRGVSLGGRRLAGEMPDMLGRLSDLYVLDLGANELTGGFPGGTWSTGEPAKNGLEGE